MADSDDEGGGAIRFDNSADFEGGTYGEDGEFYYEYQRVGKQQTKEDAIYGIFGDEEDSHRGLGSYGRSGSTTVSASDMGWVSSGILAPSEEPETQESAEKEKNAEQDKAEEKEKEEEEEDDGVSSTLKKAVDRKRQQQRGGREKEEEQAKKKQKAAPKFDKDFGKWQKNTTGFGMKYLLKFQFKGRLGKNESGVANPILPKMRERNAGLAYGGRSELNESEVRNREEIGLAATKKEGKGKEQEAKKVSQPNWKKKAPKTKTIYKTAAELRAESAQTSGGVPSDLILDMRGPTTRMASLKDLKSMEQVAEEKAAEEETVSTLPELAYNIRQLVQQTENSIHEEDRAIQSCKDSLLALAAERKRVEAAHKEAEVLVQDMESVCDLLKRCQARLAETKGKEAEEERANSLADVWEQVADKYRPLFVKHKLHTAAAAMCTPLMAALTKDWLPVVSSLPSGASQVPQYRQDCLKKDEDICHLLVRWRPLLMDGPDTDDEKTGNGVSSSYNDVLPFRPGRSQSNKGSMGMGGTSLQEQDTSWDPSAAEDNNLYQKLLTDLVLPRLQVAITSRWQVKDFPPLLHLFKLLRPALSKQMGRRVMAELVVPKLKIEVDRWNPRMDPTPIDAWIHPWLADIPPQTMTQIYSAIRHKFARVLEHWHPSDNSALVVLKPWKEVWRVQDMQMFLARTILPKLRHCLSVEFAVNPQQQHIEPFRWAMRWESLLEPPAIFALLNECFWPKWFHALYTWLKSSPEFDEVTRWYLGWKSELSEKLAETAYAKSMFSKGLDLMNLALEGGALEPLMDTIMAELQGLPPPTPVLTAQQQQAQLQAQQAQAAAQQGRLGQGAGGTAKDFMENVAQIAALNNLEFVPNAKRDLQEGKQVYYFGKVNVYVDNTVLYYYEQDVVAGGGWRPISLPVLLQRALAIQQQEFVGHPPGSKAPPSTASETGDGDADMEID